MERWTLATTFSHLGQATMSFDSGQDYGSLIEDDTYVKMRANLTTQLTKEEISIVFLFSQSYCKRYQQNLPITILGDGHQQSMFIHLVQLGSVN
ncbi:hypothetical protein GOBAR_AA19278 [Gossypium barbadense]|uniref:Uncharacterized protein n=1 Tax=Gossypium barbadense TaxID=3634 RepID=A0A2P5XDG8_GOSBA|nr:hypothetical protein GOBAR_AA19278 [Gossypium barbadense]